jgi:hypothetical protein
VLSVDLPSGMNGDTGQPTGEVTVQAQATLSLLTLKPGLFTGRGRDLAARCGGTIWASPRSRPGPATAWITGEARSLWPRRQHAQHKGSFGDLWVLAGARGMTGAACWPGGPAWPAAPGASTSACWTSTRRWTATRCIPS